MILRVKDYLLIFIIVEKTRASHRSKSLFHEEKKKYYGAYVI